MEAEYKRRRKEYIFKFSVQSEIKRTNLITKMELK